MGLCVGCIECSDCFPHNILYLGYMAFLCRQQCPSSVVSLSLSLTHTHTHTPTHTHTNTHKHTKAHTHTHRHCTKSKKEAFTSSNTLNIVEHVQIFSNIAHNVQLF